MRVVFLGNAKWSVASLEAIAGSGHDLVLVVTRAPRPGGRGNRPIPTAVAEVSRRSNLPLAEVDSVKGGAGFEAISRAEPDVLAVVAYGEILPQAVLELPAVAPVNVHFSLLPALRGAAPVQRAILEGLHTTGVTTIRMDEGMDTGPILLQAEEPVAPEDDAGSLGDRLAVIGGRLLRRTLDGLEAGTIRERLQDHGSASLAPKLKAEDRIIDWSRPAEEIVRRVRALAPDPGARTTFRDKELKLVSAGVAGLPGDAPAPEASEAPGTVVSEAGVALGVRAGDGRVVDLRVVHPAGKRAMDAEAFVRGYRPEPGERLGAAGPAQPGR